MRASRIEWEHIVPASEFGKNIIAWKSGDPSCKTKSGHKFSGRRCARSVSKEFRVMEADLYNLVPAIGEINQRRSNLPYSDKYLNVSGCQTRVLSKYIVPRKQIRGMIARAYLYMHAAYPGFNIINNNNRVMFTRWNKKYPPSNREIIKANKIASIQGNINPYIVKWKLYIKNN